MNTVHVVGAAITDRLDRPTRLLAARRTAPAALAGGWELPGGKVEPGESDEAAFHREIREELGCVIRLGDLLPGPLPDGRWPLTDRLTMQVRWAVLLDGVPRPLEDHDELRWLERGDLRSVPWLPADGPIVDALETYLT